jgi:hypothetical protein
MRGTDGKPTVSMKTWISCLTGGNRKNGPVFGELTAGYGSSTGRQPMAAANGFRIQFAIQAEVARGNLSAAAAAIKWLTLSRIVRCSRPEHLIQLLRPEFKNAIHISMYE